jgi:hypothetical protein
LTKTIFRTGYNYEDDIPEKEKEKEKDTDEIEPDIILLDKNGESIIDNNSLLST